MLTQRFADWGSWDLRDSQLGAEATSSKLGRAAACRGRAGLVCRFRRRVF